MSNLETLLSTAFLVPQDDPMDPNCMWGLNVMLWGEPGIGKSERIEMAAAMTGLPPRTIYASTTAPEDISGAAFANATRGSAMIEAAAKHLRNLLASNDNSFFQGLLRGFREPLVGAIDAALAIGEKYGPANVVIESLLPGIADLMVDGQGVLFLDELGSAKPAVQAAYLGVVLARRAGGRKLPPGVRVVAAANPPESAAGGWELEPPMANRFCHFVVDVPTVDAWREWFTTGRSNKVDAIEDGENRVRQRWANEWPVIQGQIAGFMKSGAAGKDPLHKIPQEGLIERGRAWPSPRTWVFAARAAATCRCLDLPVNVRDMFIEGCVGEAMAVQFAAWVLASNVPTAEDMIANGWMPDLHRLDRSVAAYTGLIGHCLSRRTPEEKKVVAPGAWRCLDQGGKNGLIDIVLPYAQQLVRGGMDSKLSPETYAAARPVMLELAKRGMSNFVSNPGQP